jgi:hypothetical protein
METDKMVKRELSRRTLFKGAGLLVIGAAGLTATSGNLAFMRPAEAKGGPAEKWPWPYVKLDLDKTAELAYNEFYRVACGAAVVSSVLTQLREKVGEPYLSFPIDSFAFLEGGIAGWGTICGASAGANIVTNLIIGPKASGSEEGILMGSEILQWSSETSMPTFTPKDPKVKTEIQKSTANSPLCHVSVGKWMKVSRKELGSPERRDRCARLTASVAFHLAELMNEWKNGTYKTKGTIPSKTYGIHAQRNCDECHY